MQRLARCMVVLSLLAFLGTLSAPRLAGPDQHGAVRVARHLPGAVPDPLELPGSAHAHAEPGSLPGGAQLGRGHQLHLGEPRLPGGVRGDDHRLRAGPGQRERQSEPAPGLPDRGGSPAGGLLLRPDLSRARLAAGQRRLRAVVGRPDERALRGGRQRPGRSSSPPTPWASAAAHHAPSLRVPAQRPGGVRDSGGRQHPAPSPDRPGPLPSQRHLRAGRRIHLGGQGVPRGVRGRDGGRRGRPRIQPGRLCLVAQHAPAVRDSSRRAGAARPPDERGTVPDEPELGGRAGLRLGDPRLQRRVRGDGRRRTAGREGGRQGGGGSSASPARPRGWCARSSAPPPSGWSSS